MGQQLSLEELRSYIEEDLGVCFYYATHGHSHIPLEASCMVFFKSSRYSQK